MNLARTLITLGLAITGLGVLAWLMNRANLPIGRLPGDLIWRGKNTTFYFPWVTCLVLSLLGTLVLWLMNRRT